MSSSGKGQSVMRGDKIGEAYPSLMKALSSGNDLRVWSEGEELYRTLITWNTKRTQVCFLVTIPSGQSQTYYLVYGNPNAYAPGRASTSATPIEIAVAAVVSKPTAVPMMMFVAGPVREALAISWTGRHAPAV